MSKRINRKLIISTAFEEWGKFFFKNMSLSLITNKLQISKPALYRHFKNKKSLLDEMSNFLLNELINVSFSFINKVKTIDKKEVVLLFISEYFYFFGNNLNYFLFYIFYSVKDNYFENKEIIKIHEKLYLIFSDYIKNINTWLKPEDSENLVRFVYSTGIFLTMFSIHKNLENNKTLKKLNNTQINKIIESVHTIVTKGFKINDTSFEINFKDIENNCFNKNLNFEQNKIFEAIANVVAKYGLWNASIKKIADELGVGKSNLYLYFKNKNEMISDMIIKKMNQRNKIVKENIMKYSDFFEKMYAAFVTIFSYLVNDKKIILVFDWFHFQGFDFKKVHSQRIKLSSLYAILKEGVDKKIINADFFNLEFITAFLNMQIIKEILLLSLMNKKFELKNIRFIFNIILSGILKERL